MVKSKEKVNMKSIKIFIGIVFLLFFSVSSVQAVVDRGNSPYMQNYVDPNGGAAGNIFEEILRVFFGQDIPDSPKPFNNGSEQNSIDTPAQNVLDPNQLANYPTPQTVNGFKVYRQCNYRNINVVNNCKKDGTSATMCNMGCGMTSVAMILSTLLQDTIDPIQVWKKYNDNGASISCAGTNVADAKTVIESYKSRGIQTSATNLFSYGHNNAASIDEVASDIRQKVKNGWYVFVLADFCEGGCGHFFVITDIDDNNVVTSYDPYYEPPEASRLPINYTNRYPFPKYRTAFAVKKS